MSKLYLLLASFCISQLSLAQCPVIKGALINACAADGVTEGINEFVYFTTAATGTAAQYKLSYGSRNPPASQSPTGYLSGLDATAKFGPGSIIVDPGYTLIEVTASSTSIPSGSSVVFIPYNFDQAYNFTNLCINNTVYVVYININSSTATDSRWLAGGTMANAATSLRYIQIAFNGDDCTGNVRSYDGALWPYPGNIPEAEGNSLAWNEQDSLSYLNNGCSRIIVTPVKLVAFTAVKNGADAMLKWKTAAELSTKEFWVEWSANGKDFYRTGTVTAFGTSDVERNYSFLHKNVAAGNNFYRLKIIDENGGFSYSPVAKLNFAATGSIRIYPVLANNNLTIELNAAKQEAAALMIVDHTGRLLSSKKIQLASGYNSIQYTVGNLPAGEYLIRLAGSTGNYIARFVKL